MHFSITGMIKALHVSYCSKTKACVLCDLQNTTSG